MAQGLNGACSGATAHGEVVFVTPSPAMLQAGAVWVTINNWVHASRRRWGKASLLTPEGFLTDGDLRDAAWGDVSDTQYTTRFGELPHVAHTAAKDLRAWWRMHRFQRSVRRVTFDVPPLFVWQHHDLFQRAGFNIARRYGVPLVLFVDAPIVWEASSWGVNRPLWGQVLERLAEAPQLREADVVACVTEEVAEAAVARGAVQDRILVTPCTADLIRQATPRTYLRRELELEDAVVVGWVGSFRRFHHADMIVRAVAELQRADNVALLMVGQGATRDSCVDLVEELGVRRAVFTGAVPHDHVVDHLAAMDVAVIPSAPDGEFHYSPLKLKEYLAAGKAVVAPATGEMDRLLHDGEDVLFYAPGDVKDMVRALERLTEDEPLRRALGQRGRETYDRLFTMDRQLGALATALGLP